MTRALLCAAALAIAAAGCSTSVNWQTPRAYPCSRQSADPDQCPGGWVCGLEGSCHDPAQAFPFLCEGDPDCAPAWRCGRSGVCHDRDAGAPYPCAADTDCERGWRCAVDGLCVDAAADAVTPGATYGTLAVTAVSPTSGVGLPDLVSGAHTPLSDGYGNPTDAYAFTVVRGQALTQLTHFPNLYFTGSGFNLVLASSWSALLPEVPRSVATVGLRGYFLDSQGLGSLQWQVDAGVTARYGGAAAGTNWIRASSDPTQVLLAANDSALQLFDTRTNTVRTSGIRLPARDGGTQRLWDVAAGESTGMPATDARRLWMAAAGDDGLYVAYRTDAGSLVLPDGGPATSTNAWQPLDYPRFPHRACPGTDGGYRPLRLFRSSNPDDNFFGVEAVAWGDDPNTAPRLVATIDGTAPYDPFPPCGTIYGVSTWGPCPACAAGETRTYAQFFRGGASVGCVSADGKTQRSIFYLGDCQPRPEVGPAFYGELLRPGIGRMEPSVMAGAAGELWDIEPDIHSVTLDHAPALLYGSADLGSGSTGLAAVDPLQGLWIEQPGIGLTTLTFPGAADDPNTYAAAVDGKLEWVVTVDAAGAPQKLKPSGFSGYEFSFPQVSDSHAPFTATAGFRSDGGMELLVGVFDKLMAAPFWLDAGVLEVSALEVKSVPSPFIPITSVATAAPPGGGTGPELVSYVLTQNGLYQVTTAGEHLWQTATVSVPPASYLKVWFDGSRGRLGDVSGNVFALPSRTRLAPALPGGARAIDYASLCGRTLALSTSGLHELRPDPAGGGVGVWSPLDVSAYLGPSDPLFASGRLARDGKSVVLVTGRGTVLRFNPPAGCPGP